MTFEELKALSSGDMVIIITDVSKFDRNLRIGNKLIFIEFNNANKLVFFYDICNNKVFFYKSVYECIELISKLRNDKLNSLGI